MWRIMLFAGLLLGSILNAQEGTWEKYDIQYRLLQTHYGQSADVIKIKVPPYLSTSQLMTQCRLALQWPGDPLPRKKTTIYVYRDDDPLGTKSGVGLLYTPGKEIQWDLAEWQPDTLIFSYQPTPLDQVIYNTVLDSLYAEGMYASELESDNAPVKKQLAEDFQLTVPQLDSIYYRVKRWGELKKKRRNRP